jgi:ketosteroid isomerase-like protein
MDRSAVENWVAAYERAWRTPGTDALGELFTPDIAYVVSPWAAPLEGLDRVASFWEAGRKGPDEEFTMTSEVVAVDGDVAVVRLSVAYGTGDDWRDLWVMRFDADGRCAAFEEWPFRPGQDDGHGDDV